MKKEVSYNKKKELEEANLLNKFLKKFEIRTERSSKKVGMRGL